MKSPFIVPLLAGWLFGSLIGSALFRVPFLIADVLSGNLNAYSGTSNWLISFLFTFKMIFVAMIPGVIGAAAIRHYGVALSRFFRAMILAGFALLALILAGLWNSRFVPSPSFLLECGHLFLIVTISNFSLLPFTSPIRVEQADDANPIPR